MTFRFHCWGLAAAVALSLVGTAAAQPASGGDPVLKEVFNLLQSSAVQTELEMAPEQLDELVRIRMARHALMLNTKSKVEQVEEAQRPAVMADFQAALISVNEKCLAVLLPRQQLRVRQLAMQKLYKIGDARAGLHHERVIAELEIDDAQNKAIAEKTTEVHARVQKQVEELTKEIEQVKETGRRELFAILTPAQREKYEKLFGRPFDFNSAK